MEQSKIEKVLRMAIRQGGEVAYNPDMYKLGFADNDRRKRKGVYKGIG